MIVQPPILSPRVLITMSKLAPPICPVIAIRCLHKGPVLYPGNRVLGDQKRLDAKDSVDALQNYFAAGYLAPGNVRKSVLFTHANARSFVSIPGQPIADIIAPRVSG